MSNIVNLSNQAVYQIKHMMKENEEESSYLRFSVNGGGCSGLSYGLGFESEIQESDYIVEAEDLKILINKEHEPIVRGTNIDYKQSLMGGGFVIENPNAIASCGCGSSFRTKQNAGSPDPNC